MDRGPGGVGHKASVGGDPVDDGVGVPAGLTAQGHALTLQNFQLLRRKKRAAKRSNGAGSSCDEVMHQGGNEDRVANEAIL